MTTAATLDPRTRAILDAPNFYMVATIRSDGTPQVVPVWGDTDGEHVYLNSAEGRGWPRNLERDPRVTITVVSGENPYEYVQIQGRLVGKTTEGADEHIDRLAKKYLGVDSYPYRNPAEQRVTFNIAPERVRHRG